MYTRLDDWRIAKRISDYLIAKPKATQKELCKVFVTNEHRLRQLERDSLINLEHTRRK
jgi:hypothetical protein